MFALDISRREPEARVVRDVITYNSVISACEQVVQWTLELQFLRGMLGERVESTATPHNSAIRAREKGDQWLSGGGSAKPTSSAMSRPQFPISACEKDGLWTLVLYFDAGCAKIVSGALSSLTAPPSVRAKRVTRDVGTDLLRMMR